MSLTSASCGVLQEVQQDEAWAAPEAAPGPLPVRNVVQDDVAAPVFFKAAQTDYTFDIAAFWCLFSRLRFSSRGLICPVSLPVWFSCLLAVSQFA